MDLTGSDDFVSSVLTSVREILSVSAQYTNSGEAASGSTRTFINAPYLYQHNQTEKVSLNSGALVYESTDDVLPGVNGLDLVLSRRYNSQEANVYYESAEEAYAFYVLYGWKASYSVPGIGTGPWSYYDQDFVEGPFWTRHEADVFVSHLPSGREGIPDFSDGADLVLNYYATIKRVVDGYSSSCKPNHYFNDLYGLGHGWSLQFSSIENIDGKKYLHLSNGNTYAIDFSSGRSHLKDYTLNDMVMTDHCSEFRVGPTISQYRLTYKDGRREYFDSRGKLIGIQDRYNHKISFSYKQWDSSDLNVVITDTLGRNTTISKQNSENGLLFMFLCQTAIHFNTM